MTRASTRARASGLIFERSSENLRAMAGLLLRLRLSLRFLLLYLRDVRGEQPIGHWNHPFIPAVVACFVAAEEQQADSSRVERIEHAVGIALMLHAQLTHRTELRSLDLRAIWEGQCRPPFDQQPDAEVDRFLLVAGKAVPPVSEL